MCARFAQPKGVAEVLPDGHFNLLINISFPKLLAWVGGGGGGGGRKMFRTYHFSLIFELMYRNLYNFSKSCGLSSVFNAFSTLSFMHV